MASLNYKDESVGDDITVTKADLKKDYDSYINTNVNKVSEVIQPNEIYAENNSSVTLNMLK